MAWFKAASTPNTEQLNISATSPLVGNGFPSVCSLRISESTAAAVVGGRFIA